MMRGLWHRPNFKATWHRMFGSMTREESRAALESAREATRRKLQELEALSGRPIDEVEAQYHITKSNGRRFGEYGRRSKVPLHKR